MIIDGMETDSVVLYDSESKEICGIIADNELVIPENCDVAVFRKGSEPLLKEENGIVKLKGAIVGKGVNGIC